METQLRQSNILRQLDNSRLRDIRDTLEAWGVSAASFPVVLDAWLRNFDRADLDLALKVLTAIDYYSESRLEGEFADRLRHLEQNGIFTSGPDANAVVVVPSNPADSAYRHAWLLSKLRGLDASRFLTIDDLGDAPATAEYFVFVNDTHGSGKQFMTEFWPRLHSQGISGKAVVIVGIAIASEARQRFSGVDRHMRVFPSIDARCARHELTAAEFERVSQLGAKVYSRDPVGYGGTALLVAYHFQCPNNTLPIIWADGEWRNG